MTSRAPRLPRALFTCALIALPKLALADPPDGGGGGAAAPSDSGAGAGPASDAGAAPAPPPAANATNGTAAPPPASAPAAEPPATGQPASGPATAAPADPPATRAETPPPATPAAPEPPEQGVVVVARGLDRVPGSVTLVRREDIRQMAPQHAGDVLRTVPGVNVAAEDGAGLRLNIGIRGLDPNRSRKVLILEDGIPVSLNPYGSPELYYTPPIEHVERIEVVRGSGQILWGPQTIGGVINYITRDPPRQLSAHADLRYGTYGYFLAEVGGGGTHGPIGWRLDVVHRRFEGPRRLDLSMVDISGRLRLQVTQHSVLGVRVNVYDEASRATYVGPTASQFATDPTFNPAEHDRFLVRRYAFALTHQQHVSDAVQVNTNAYAYQTGRAWRRQEFDRTDLGANYERVCDGLARCGPRGAQDVMPTASGDSLFFRYSAAIRDRLFNVAGVEPRLTWRWTASRLLSGELTALVRLHHESARDRIVVTSSPVGEWGDTHEDEFRQGIALAAAVQNRFSIGSRVQVTPGLRIENFWSMRHIVRAAVTTPTGQRMGSDVSVFGEAYSWALIPGLGVSVNVAQPVTLYAGVHRGYAPPRTRDAVSPAGVNLQLDPELSWNSELGARLRVGRWLTADVAGFWLEFENQIIPPSESGAVVSGGTFNTGHSRHAGAEGSVTFDLAPLAQPRGATFALPLMVNYTWVPVASFVGGLWGDNRLPYAPEHQLYVQLRFVHQSGFSTQLGFSYVGSQYTNKENTPVVSADGLIGAMPGYANLDARVAYAHRPTGLTFSVVGRSLADQIYVANRAPQGIQPGGFRQVFFGIEWAWPRGQ